MHYLDSSIVVVHSHYKENKQKVSYLSQSLFIILQSPQCEAFICHVFILRIVAMPPLVACQVEVIVFQYLQRLKPYGDCKHKRHKYINEIYAFNNVKQCTRKDWNRGD